MEMHFSALQEPRGFIRIIQAIFAIFAFATTSGFGSSARLRVMCSNFNDVATFKFSYPFRMAFFPFEAPKTCNATSEDVTMTTIVLPYSFASNAEFFVATGVLSLAFCCGIIFIYVLRSKMYRENQTVPLVDLGLTALLAIFWFAGSCAWAQGVSDIKYYTNPTVWQKRVPICAESFAKCETEQKGNFATLNVSLILGFANTLLWAASGWFVFKDTILHNQMPGGGGVPGMDGAGIPGSQYPPVGSTQYAPQSPTGAPETPKYVSQY